MSDKILAYYFAPENNKLRYGDNREIVVGESHEVSCKPEVCVQGLHASIKPLEALAYATHHQLYIVNISGDVNSGHDKIAGKCREYLIKVPKCDQLLREFSRKVALMAVTSLSPNINPVVIKYLTTGSKDLRLEAWHAARAATSDAARAAAWDAARAAANAAARAAANAASKAAARAAANAAAKAAAYTASKAAARAAANAAAYTASKAAARAAAKAAARAAAWDASKAAARAAANAAAYTASKAAAGAAAWSNQNKMLESLIEEYIDKYS